MKTLVLISVRTYVYTLYVYLVLPHISPISHNAILTNEGLPYNMTKANTALKVIV